MFAKVIVDIKSNEVNESFDYHIPKTLREYVFVGSRVLVSFGFNDVLGYVIEINETSEFSCKDIIDVFDFEKELTSEQVELAKKLSFELNAPLISCLDLMLPAFLKEKKQKFLYIEDYKSIHPDLALLFGGKKKVKIDQKILDKFHLVRQEINKNNIQVNYNHYAYGKNKKIKLYYVDNPQPQKSKIRNLVVEYLKSHPESSANDIQTAIDVSKDLINKLEKEQQILTKEVTVLKPQTQIRFNETIDFNIDQQQLYEKFIEGGYKPYLLFSNDEEFKINFYIKLVNEFKKLVFFAPTIMVVEELAFYLQKIKGLNLFTYHSKNSNSENYDVYMNVKNNNYDCLITTSLGTFLPFQESIVIVVIDEENSHYLHENFPYYDTREVLKIRAKTLNSKIIFDSMAPSINAFYQMRRSKYYLLEYNKKPLGEVIVVDMKDEFLEENNLIVSKVLKENIKQALAKNKISLLIVNNKSFSTLIRCRDCGAVLECPKCKISLNYIKSKNIAKCNYCEYKTEVYSACDKCKSTNIVHYGFGLEQVYHKITMEFPKANIMQIDSDHLKSLDDYNQVLLAIEEQTVDIIIGTNALTNKLKYDNIMVIGLLYVDSYLNISDHRSAEWTYQLIAKMTSKENLVVQTYHKDHYAIKHAISNNYEAFYDSEIEIREVLNYEPFIEMNRIVITGPYEKLFHFGYYYRKAIRRVIGEENILGPSYDYRLQGVKLVIKHNQYDIVTKVLNDAIKNFNEPKLLVRFERYPKGM